MRVPEPPALEEVVEHFTLVGPKIPASLFSRVLAFFEAVSIREQAEAIVLLTFENGEWEVIIPEQEVSGSSVSYRNPMTARLAGSIHSHPNMTAFSSATDERDESQFDGIHIVVGNRGFVRPDVSCVAVVADRRIDVDPEDLIEGFDDDSDFPEKWLERVRPSTSKQFPLFGTSAYSAHAAKDREPLCGSCTYRSVCDLASPDDCRFCGFFEPAGAGREE